MNHQWRMTNGESVSINDEARMTNDKGMTKSEAQNRGNVDDSFRNEDADWVIREEPEKNRVYDLEERTARFGEGVIDFAKTIPQNPVTNRLISQLVGAGTSVGANYVEADDSVSKKDFLKSIGTCRKEARETKHFLRMIARAVPELKLPARELWMEARELHLIFSRIWRGRKNEL
jgi:four helix bundle protein